MAKSYFRSALVFAPLLACAPAIDAETRADAVVGGTPESGYSAVGFLLDLKHGGEVFCGATLIAPDVAVTAAHCVEPASGDDRYVMGLGAVADNPPEHGNVRRRVVAAIRHPSYDPAVADVSGSAFDIAVVKLDAPVTDREPAALGPATVSCEHRYVGYGRSTPGGLYALHTTWGERKSAQTCVRRQSDGELFVRGVDGGNCWGDSGGPLMVEGKNEIVAVMSRFQPLSPIDTYECRERNDMIMIRIDAHHDFLREHASALAE